jgi:hypothetical protein
MDPSGQLSAVLDASFAALGARLKTGVSPGALGPSVQAQTAAWPEQGANALLTALGPLGDAGRSVGDMLRTGRADPRDLPVVAGNMLLGTMTPGGPEGAGLERALMSPEASSAVAGSFGKLSDAALSHSHGASDPLERVLATIKDIMSEGYEGTKTAGGVGKSSTSTVDDATFMAQLEKTLSKNPGASIFDVAGVPEHAGPSTSWKSGSTMPTQVFDLGDFPREAPFGNPPRAASLGFQQPAVHGTAVPEGSWRGGLDRLMLPKDQIGVHFGNPKQAAYFTGNMLGGIGFSRQPRTYPVVLRTGNQLTMPDMGMWHLQEMIEGLHRMNADEYSVLGMGRREPSPHAGEFPDEELAPIETIEDMRDYLAKKGYDSIKYINRVEDKGQPSYIMFQPSAEDPKFIAGARSPWAAFDPAKLGAPGLTLGLAGAGAGAASPLFFDEHGNMLLARDTSGATATGDQKK